MSDERHPSAPPGVLIVSADRRVRDGLTSLLVASGQAVVLGPAAGGEAALELVRATTPDAVVVDLRVAIGVAQKRLLAELRRLAPGARLLAIAWDGEVERGVGRGIVDSYIEADGRSHATLEETLQEVLAAD